MRFSDRGLPAGTTITSIDYVETYLATRRAEKVRKDAEKYAERIRDAAPDIKDHYEKDPRDKWKTHIYTASDPTGKKRWEKRQPFITKLKSGQRHRFPLAMLHKNDNPADPHYDLENL